jgi:hypothetical protein
VDWSLRDMDKNSHTSATYPNNSPLVYIYKCCLSRRKAKRRERNCRRQGKDMGKDNHGCSGDVLICEVVSGPSPERQAVSGHADEKTSRRVDILVVQLVPNESMSSCACC